MNVIPASAGFVLACFVAFTLQIFFFSPISPDPLRLPSPSSIPSNRELQKVGIVGEGVIEGPEDLFVDKDGVVYTVARDGWIRRMQILGGDGRAWERWRKIESSSALGIAPSMDGTGVLIADAELGLVKVTDDGPTVLASHVNGSKIRFRCQKYWLTGAKKGRTEMFVENLPGGPDNIHLAPDGSFWIGLLQVVSEGQEFVHASKLLKHLVASNPRLLGLLSRGPRTKARVVNVGSDGKIIKMLEDPDGEVISFVTTAFEFEDHLYLGSLASSFVGKLSILDVAK